MSQAGQPLYVDPKDLPKTAEMTVVIPVTSEQVGIRLLGYLKELGISSSIKEDDGMSRLHVTCSVTRVQHINFALYLTHEWTRDHADF